MQERVTKMQLSHYADMADLDNVYLTMEDIREIAERDPDSYWFNSLKSFGVSEQSLQNVVKVSPVEYRFVCREYDSFAQIAKSYRVHSVKLSVGYRGSSPESLRPYWRVDICACSDPESDRTYFATRKAAEKALPNLVRDFG
jgi:hypothetical protein